MGKALRRLSVVPRYLGNISNKFLHFRFGSSLLVSCLFTLNRNIFVFLMITANDVAKVSFDLMHLYHWYKLTTAASLPPANEVWGKVIFLHLSVILFTGRVPGQVLPGQVHTPWTGTPPGQVQPPRRYTPWVGTHTPLQAGTPS